MPVPSPCGGEIRKLYSCLFPHPWRLALEEQGGSENPASGQVTIDRVSLTRRGSG